MYCVCVLQLSPTMCLQVMGNIEPGAKVVLWTETRQPIQTWTTQMRGLITSLTFPGMVLDVKGMRRKTKQGSHGYWNTCCVEGWWENYHTKQPAVERPLACICSMNSVLVNERLPHYIEVLHYDITSLAFAVASSFLLSSVTVAS